MKIHNFTVKIMLPLAICFLGISFIFLIWDSRISNLLQNIAIGIMTSSMVTGFVSLIAYFNEKDKFISNLYKNLCTIYLNLHTLLIFTSSISMQVENNFSFQDNAIERLSIGNNLSYEAKNKINIFDFIPLCKKSCLQKQLISIDRALNGIIDIHNQIGNINLHFLERKLMITERETIILNQRNTGNTNISTEKYDVLINQKFIVLCELAGKLHGCAETLLNEIETNIIGLERNYKLKPKWEIAKVNILHNVTTIKNQSIQRN